MQHESIKYDVVIIGAGPAGLSAAITLKDEANQNNKDVSVCIIEKGSSLGSHNLSGAVLEPKHLLSLIPGIKNDPNSPLKRPAISDSFCYLTKNKSFRLPTPKTMKNEGNFIISLSQLCQYLGDKAESLGVEIYPGFAASDILYNESGEVIGIATQPMGIDKRGEKKSTFEPGMHIYAKQTLFAEGARGSLSEKVIKRFSLRKNKDEQTYGLGVKEVWQVPKNKPGHIFHSIGWPLDNRTYGGSFIYHLDENKISLGFVVGLDYQNPYLDIFKELQRFKTHPDIAPLFAGGERLYYGARALTEGGVQSLPKLTFPGGALIGDAAGFLNVAKIKGIHNAIHSGQIVAKEVLKNLEKCKEPIEIASIEKVIEKSPMYKELYHVRNIRPSFHFGTLSALIYCAIDQYIFQGKAPWTLHHKIDHESLKPKDKSTKIHYPKPDYILSFDKASSLYLSGTFHDEDQPCHLKLKDEKKMTDINLKIYDSPETRYCPAGVYENITNENGEEKLQINAQNCLHCKTCDIKDPSQNIAWTTPEGGGGPKYTEM